LAADCVQNSGDDVHLPPAVDKVPL
jgi:hypothetical protein